MKIKDIALSAAYVGQRVVKAICVGAQEVWSAIKYIVFADPVVEQICAENWGDGTGLSEEDAAKVTSLGTVFKGNTEITSFEELVEFTGLTSISAGAFSQCSNLSSVKLPNGITVIAGDAFVDCSSLSNIDIPDGVTTLGYGSFARSGLTRIVIPNSVTTISGSAFISCTKLKTVKFGAGITNIGSSAFGGVKADNIYVDSISAWCNYPIGGMQSAKAKLYVREELVTDVVIPANITQLRSCVFCNFLDIKTVSFEGDITTIGGDAFADCGLTSFVCPQGVVSCSGSVFPRCKSLKTLDLSNYHGDIEAYFCIACSTLSIVKLGAVTSIGYLAFSQCYALQSVLIDATTPPTLSTSVFEGSAIIYVPDTSVEAYKTASNWSTYASRIKQLSEYVES